MAAREDQRRELHRTIWQIANDSNLSVSSHVEGEDTREAVDITAPNAEIARIVARQQEPRTTIDAIVADLEGVS